MARAGLPDEQSIGHQLPQALRANRGVEGIIVAAIAECVCETCGEPARVHVLEEYRQGAPVFRHACLDCADRAMISAHHTVHHNRASMASLLIGIGIFFGVLGVAADYIAIPTGNGFGWLRLLGLGVGALFVLVGTLIRVDAIGIAGAILFGLTACVSLFGLTQVSGLGWKQQLAMTIGLMLILTGLLLRRWANGASGEQGERLTERQTDQGLAGRAGPSRTEPNKGGAG